MIIFLLVLGFALLALIDVPGLIKKKYYKELVIYSVLMAFALTLIILQTYNINEPNPARDTQYVVQSFFRLLHLTYD